jgi:hypothetical protein
MNVFISINTNSSIHSSTSMFRQVMVAIITQLGQTQTYKEGVSSGFVMTAINTHYNNNRSSKNNKRYATHEPYKGL